MSDRNNKIMHRPMNRNMWNEPWNDDATWFNNPNSSSYFMMNHMTPLNSYNQMPNIHEINCGEVRPRDEGSRVKISGKVVKRPNTGRFLEIKDIKGSTQLVATDDKPEIALKFQTIPTDAYISAIGSVQLRPRNFINFVSFFIIILHPLIFINHHLILLVNRNRSM